MGGIMGVDPSMTSTGLAHWSPTDGWDTALIESKGKNSDTYQQTGERLDNIVARVERVRYRWAPSLIVVEVPAMSRGQAHTQDRAGLYHLLCRAWRVAGDVRVAFADPQARICWMLGKFAGSKDAVMAAAIRRYMDAPITNNDTADAVVTVAMGVWHEHGPNTGLAIPPKDCQRGLTRVEWPSTTARAPSRVH